MSESDERYIVVEDTTGEVVNVVVGLPELPSPYIAVIREGLAAEAAIGMCRRTDGKYAYPGADS